MEIKLRNPIQISKKSYFNGNKANNKFNEYLKAVYKYFGNTTQYSFRDINPEQLTKLYSGSSGASPIIYTLINKRARLTSEVMRYAEVYKTGTNEIVENHPALKIINNPNDLEDSRDLFVNRLSVDLDLYGECFTYKEKVGTLEPKINLYPMYSEKTDIREGGLRKPIKDYVYDYDETNPLPTKDVMWIRQYNPDPKIIHGLSPIIPATRMVELLESGDTRLLNAFKNGGVNSLLSPKDTELGATPDETDDAEEQVNSLDNVGKTKFIKIPMDVLKLGDTPLNLGVLETSEYAIQILCFVYDYPYEMFMGTAKYSNQKEAKKLLYTQIGIPQATTFCQSLTKFLGLDKENLELRISIDKIDAMKEDVDKLMTAYVNANVSIYEKHKLLGLEPPEGEEYKLPVIPQGVDLGYMPVDENAFSDE